MSDSKKQDLPLVKAKPKLAVTPRLRIVLVVVLGLFSLLFANGLYLSAITFLQWWTTRVYEDYFYQLMFLLHLVLGFLIILPVIGFGFYHWRASYQRRNKRAIKIGYALLFCSIVILLSGILLTRVGSINLVPTEASRRLAYWAHVISPLVVIWLYWLHRLVGARIKWYVARRIGVAMAIFVGAMVLLQIQDPRDWNAAAPKEGDQYFNPSLARTRTGNFISERSLMNDDYCKKCHQDIYDDWFHSAHHFSSFNNPAYLYAVRETRQVAFDRDGSVQASRWCAGCHDPVPFFSGAFDDPNYDDVNHPTSQAGITCTVCHAITKLNSNRGNADYIIEEPVHYPFTYSDNSMLQGVNELLVKAKPSFHKAEMIKPFHKSAEFCSTCHKVHLPGELTNYKEFLRGQNHYDSYLLSGVSGHGARSFYYPTEAETNCNGCHMPLRESNDFAAFYDKDSNTRVVHDHFFPGANTALPYWRGDDEQIERARSILVGSARVDIFGIRKEGTIEGELIGGIRPEVPTLKAGESYLLESVIRTLKVGHHLTQGTVDSNELWLEVVVKSGDRMIGANGTLDQWGEVDRWAHFVNNFVLDRNGDRISRRNAQDIFVPLYDHQIPPGSGQIAHYRLEVPQDISHPIEVSVKLNYRKFDKEFVEFMHRVFREGDHDFASRTAPEKTVNLLPITVIAEDRVVFPIETEGGNVISPEGDSLPPVEPAWQRWNDYGIGLLLAGNSQLRQAAEAFEIVESLGRYDGPLNLARVLLAEGSLDEATDALTRASKMEPHPPAWTFAWLSGELARQQGYFEEAEANFRSALDDITTERINRKFDFSRDYVVRNQLGSTLIDRAEQAESRRRDAEAQQLLNLALAEFQKVLEIDSENNSAHANLRDVYSRLANYAKTEVDAERFTDLAQYHGKLNARYKPDDNAANVARPLAKQKYPWADHASEQLVIYPLHHLSKKEMASGDSKDESVTRSGSLSVRLDEEYFGFNE